MPHDHSRRFDPANLQRLEDPDRQRYLPVDRILSLAGIKPRMAVADIGVGTGYFAIPIAKLIAPEPLFAVDVSPEMLDYLRNKLAQPAMPKNIQLVQGEATVTPLAAASCDVVFASSMWHEIDDHSAALCEFARILRPQGRLVILDWDPKGTRPPGPPIDHRIPLADVKSKLTAAQWHISRADALNEHVYLVVAQRP